MTDDALPDAPPARPLWLLTLADLALLLVGFFVLVQATDRQRPRQGLARRFRRNRALRRPIRFRSRPRRLSFAPGSAVPQRPPG